MKIGIDVFSFDRPGENYGVGPGVYVWHLLPELFRIGKEHEFYIFANRDNECMIPRLPNVKIIVSKLPNKVRSIRIIHEQINVVYFSIKYKLSIVHFLGNNIAFGIASKSIITIYDLMWKYYFDKGNRGLKYYYTLITIPNSIRKAGSIITISGYIASQVNEVYGRKNNVYPILLAPCNLKPLSDNEILLFEKKYFFDFIFTVTTSMPHKNLIALLKAYKILKDKGNLNFKLIIAGQLKGEFHLANEEFIINNEMQEDVIMTGFVSEEEKSFLYRKAKIVVYPSLYEGFGLPVLEAMSVGTPVITSNAASIPEVGGEACLYFNPDNVEELASLIDNSINNNKLLSDLSEAGFVQFKKFSWERVAMETLNVYENQKLVRG